MGNETSIPELGELSGSVLIVAIVALAIVALFAILTIIAEWRIFTKMGEKGWKSLIPVYNFCILYIRCSKKQFIRFILLYLVSVAIAVYIAIIGTETQSLVLALCMIAELICAILMVVVEIKMVHGISKSFGHGKGFTVGLILMPLLFTLILGLGSSEYEEIE